MSGTFKGTKCGEAFIVVVRVVRLSGAVHCQTERSREGERLRGLLGRKIFLFFGKLILLLLDFNMSWKKGTRYIALIFALREGCQGGQSFLDDCRQSITPVSFSLHPSSSAQCIQAPSHLPSLCFPLIRAHHSLLAFPPHYSRHTHRLVGRGTHEG